MWTVKCGYNLKEYLVLLKLMSFKEQKLQVITWKKEDIKPKRLYDPF